LLGTIILCLLVGVYLAAYRRFRKPGSSAPITKHKVETPADDVLQYWTANKLRQAKAMDLPNTDALKPGKQHQQRPPHTSDPQHP
jgi:hypothetical protein